MKTSNRKPVKNLILRSHDYDLRSTRQSGRSHYKLRRRTQSQHERVASGGLQKQRKETNAKKGKRKLEFDADVQTITGKAIKIDNRKGKQIAISSTSKPKTNPSYVCEICVEFMKPNELFTIEGCCHIYCKDCIVKYIASKLQENIIHFSCPVSGCKGRSLEPNYCRDTLPEDVFDRWNIALCEETIPMDQKFYCPLKDCSGLLINDGGKVIGECKCPYCKKSFCAQCKVAWHSGINCKEFQKLDKDERENGDIMLMNLAKERSWKRCPTCRYYVEKRYGCNHMKCRCRTSFCYECGTNIAMSTCLH